MPNLDLSILKIMHGDTRVIKIMQGDTKIWPPGFTIEGNLTNVVSSVVLPASAQMNASFTATLSPSTSCILTQVSVTMGGVDITSTAYSNGVITIANVTGDVEITASAIEVITFEDAAVKELCVNNWGGNVIAGEITPAEAAQVTRLQEVFYGNSTITKFNELRYFTGLESLYRSGTGDNVTGQFSACSLLEEITIPEAPINDFRGAFRTNGKLEEIDLTPTTATRYRMDSLVQGTSSGTYPMKKVTLPGGEVVGAMRTFYRAKQLTTIEIDGTIDLSSCSALTSFAATTPALTTITGTITGISASITFASSPLTHDSAMVIINGLAIKSGLTLTLSSATYSTLSANDIAIATNKGWNVVSS